MNWKHRLVLGLLVLVIFGLGKWIAELREENKALWIESRENLDENLKQWRLIEKGRLAEIYLRSKTSVLVRAATARWETRAQIIEVCLRAEDSKAMEWCGPVILDARPPRPPQ